MKRKILIVLVLSFLCAAGFCWQRTVAERCLRIYDYQTHELYAETKVEAGDVLFFGWVHSLEKIPWHEYYHVTDGYTLMLDTIAFPAFGAGIPENKGKSVRIEDGMIYMEGIGQEFKQFDWINSHFATREIKLNDVLFMRGKDLPEHTRLILIIERKGF